MVLILVLQLVPLIHVLIQAIQVVLVQVLQQSIQVIHVLVQVLIQGGTGTNTGNNNHSEKSSGTTIKRMWERAKIIKKVAKISKNHVGTAVLCGNEITSKTSSDTARKYQFWFPRWWVLSGSIPTSKGQKYRKTH